MRQEVDIQTIYWIPLPTLLHVTRGGRGGSLGRAFPSSVLHRMARYVIVKCQSTAPELPPS